MTAKTPKAPKATAAPKSEAREQQEQQRADSPNPSSLDNEHVEGSNNHLIAQANAEAPVAERLAPPALAASADESDAAFLLRLFGTNPAEYIKAGEGGTTYLDRSHLAHDVEAYRHLFAARVNHGRFA